MLSVERSTCSHTEQWRSFSEASRDGYVYALGDLARGKHLYVFSLSVGFVRSGESRRKIRKKKDRVCLYDVLATWEASKRVSRNHDPGGEVSDGTLEGNIGSRVCSRVHWLICILWSGKRPEGRGRVAFELAYLQSRLGGCGVAPMVRHRGLEFRESWMEHAGYSMCAL